MPTLRKSPATRDNSKRVRFDLQQNQLLVVDNWKEINRLSAILPLEL